MITAWVEIPANDVERALKFYQAVFQLGEVEIVDDGQAVTPLEQPLAQVRADKTGPSGNQDVHARPPAWRSATAAFISASTSRATWPHERDWA